MSERNPGAEVAALRKDGYPYDSERRPRYMDRIEQVLGGNVCRILRLP